MQRHAAHTSFYLCLLSSCLVLTVNAVPVPNTGKPSTQTAGEESSSFGIPYEFPDDYSISLEEALATRKEFASAAILKMVTDIMNEVAQGKRVREEMMEAIEDLQGRLKGQHEQDVIQIPLDTTGQHVRDDSRRSESKEKRPKSCRDLQKAGHSLSGFYLVRGKAQQRVDVVFCPFSNDTENDNSLVVEEAIEFVAA
ncbi:uncharacterized protein LOC130689608 [Daphnia carinata]|uniref:uncharacterized protein LOC130689608 n=1 Tax=Daphnia carinata TaxID=120202 RepID=UPI00257FC073|nr:uncharacterized protein LOC130689608 [Daphnia carinata]